MHGHAKQVLGAISLLLAISGWARPCRAAAAECPRPAEFLATGRTSDYVAAARKYLAQHVEEPAAPMVVHDLIVVATMVKDKKLADEMKARLLMDYPQSAYTRYMLATTVADSSNQNNSGNVSEYRRLLKTQITDREDVLSPSVAEKYCRGVRAGLQLWGESALADGEFLLHGALLADAARDWQLESTCTTKLAQNDDKQVREIAEAAFAPASDAEKVLRLHRVEDSKARLIERLLYQRLPHEQQELPEVIKCVAENYLADGKFRDAVPLAEKLISLRDDPQIRFWLAWCQSAQGNKALALAATAESQKRFPQDPWARAASELAGRIRDADENLDHYAQSLAKVTARLRQSGLSLFECKAVYRTESGRELGGYLALVPYDGLLELNVMDNGRLKLAYKTTDSECRVYVEGEPAVRAFNQRGIYPLFQNDLRAGADGTPQFSFNVQVADSPDAVRASGQSLADSPLLSTPEGVRQLLGYWATTGWLPDRAVRTDAGVSIYRWVRPVARRPETDFIEYRISRDGDLCGLRARQVTCEFLRYGPYGSFQLSPPAWPPLPVVRQEKLDGAVLFRMLAVAASLFTDDANAGMAAAPKEQQR